MCAFTQWCHTHNGIHENCRTPSCCGGLSRSFALATERDRSWECVYVCVMYCFLPGKLRWWCCYFQNKYVMFRGRLRPYISFGYIFLAAVWRRWWARFSEEGADRVRIYKHTPLHICSLFGSEATHDMRCTHTQQMTECCVYAGYINVC